MNASVCVICHLQFVSTSQYIQRGSSDPCSNRIVCNVMHKIELYIHIHLHTELAEHTFVKGRVTVTFSASEDVSIL